MPRATVRTLTQLVKGPALSSSQWFETIWARPGTPLYVDPEAKPVNGFLPVNTTGAGSFYMKQLDNSYLSIRYQQQKNNQPGNRIVLPPESVQSQNRDVTVAAGKTFWVPVGDIAIEAVPVPPSRGPSGWWAALGALGVAAAGGMTKAAIGSGAARWPSR